MQGTAPFSCVDKLDSRRDCIDEPNTELNYWEYFETMEIMLTLETSNMPLMDSAIALESAGSDVSELVNDVLLRCLNYNSRYNDFDLFNWMYSTSGGVDGDIFLQFLYNSGNSPSCIFGRLPISLSSKILTSFLWWCKAAMRQGVFRMSKTPSATCAAPHRFSASGTDNFHTSSIHCYCCWFLASIEDVHFRYWSTSDVPVRSRPS